VVGVMVLDIGVAERCLVRRNKAENNRPFYEPKAEKEN